MNNAVKRLKTLKHTKVIYQTDTSDECCDIGRGISTERKTTKAIALASGVKTFDFLSTNAHSIHSATLTSWTQIKIISISVQF